MNGIPDDPNSTIKGQSTDPRRQRQGTNSFRTAVASLLEEVRSGRGQHRERDKQERKDMVALHGLYSNLKDELEKFNVARDGYVEALNKNDEKKKSAYFSEAMKEIKAILSLKREIDQLEKKYGLDGLKKDPAYKQFQEVLDTYKKLHETSGNVNALTLQIRALMRSEDMTAAILASLTETTKNLAIVGIALGFGSRNSSDEKAETTGKDLSTKNTVSTTPKGVDPGSYYSQATATPKDPIVTVYTGFAQSPTDNKWQEFLKDLAKIVAEELLYLEKKKGHQTDYCYNREETRKDLTDEVRETLPNLPAKYQGVPIDTILAHIANFPARDELGKISREEIIRIIERYGLFARNEEEKQSLA